MADASSPPYALRAPAASRGESITSQLQREILGDAAVPVASTNEERDALPTTTTTDEPTTVASIETPTLTPTPRTPGANDDAEIVAISTPEALSQPLAQQNDGVPTTSSTATTTRDDRRRTLSPSKALAFFNQEGLADEVVPSSRRDTVSPEAIRSLLRGLDESDGVSRRASGAAPLGLDPNADSVDDGVLKEYLADVARTKQDLETSKMVLRQATPPGKRQRTSTTATTGTGRPTATDQDSFTDAFFSTNLLTQHDGDGQNENDTIESVDGIPSNRRATLEPMDAQAMLSELRSEMMGASAEEEKPPTHVTTTRQSPSPSPNTRSRKRRATIDPVDLATIRDGPTSGPVPATVTANRRDTIGDSDLQELRREFGLEAATTERSSARKRKPKSPSPPKHTTANATSKRTRFDESRSAAHDAGEEDVRRSRITPEKTKAREVAETDTLFSPPPTSGANKTPLKSCLSARKAKRDDQTTPNKSVNFGPPQGAEFNRGSPSTSMTPMPARAARAQFLLKDKSPPVSDDDDETALNTSLLDEVDGQDSSEDDHAAAAAAALAQRQLSIEPSVSTRTRRRYSLRGVSPLDNQANARRQRRQSAMPTSTQQQSPLVSARNRRAFEAAATAAAVAASRSVPPRTSFMSATEPTPQSRAAFADSSASSDEGEDMEITGDYTNQAATAATLHTGVRQSRLSESPRRSARLGSRQDSLFVDSPLSDGTVEVVSLGDLVAEDYRDEEKRQESQVRHSPEIDVEVSMPSLSGLARESEDEEDQQQRRASNFTESQDTNLQPIAEGDDEDRRSSSAHSRMSLESDDESDAEYDEKRKSLVVNLSSKFERFGSGTPKTRKQTDGTETSSSLKKRLSLLVSPEKRMSPSRALPSPSPQKLPDPLRIEEVLARVSLEEVCKETVERVDDSVLVTDVQRSCVAHAALSNLRFSTNEVTSWCNGLADSIPSLGREKLSRVFSTDDPGTLSRIDESIQSLQAIENVHVRSGLCQWRSKLEKTICDGLVQCENKLLSDVKTLRSMLDNDRSYRESELRAVKELMERERQMEQLLDGIEEQQAVQREYESSVQLLETDCSSLSLEASVLDQQLAAIELLSPQTDMSEATESKLRQDVLELEELLAVRESVGMWRVLSASGSKLAIASRYEDVFFSIEVRVSIDTAGPNHQATFTVTPVFTTKTRRQKHEDDARFEHDEDALSTIASVIMSSSQVERFESTMLPIAQLPSQLGALSTRLRRAYQYFSDLRAISTQFGMRLDAVDDTNYNLWVDFVRFPHVVPSGVVVDGVKFSVGHRLQFLWPYTDFDWHAQIAYGTLTKEKLRQQVDEVPRQSGHDYLTRVCQRLRDVFIQDA